MKHIKNILALSIILIISCGENNDDDNSLVNGSSNQILNNNYNVTLTSNTNVVEIDGIIELVAQTDSNFETLSVSRDGGLTFPSSQSYSFDSTVSLYFSFDTLGEKTIVLRAKNASGAIKDVPFTLNVVRGNAVKINGLSLINFQNKGGIWDSEFPATNPNSLADPFFALLKSPVNLYTGNRSGLIVSYKSPIRQNESNLNWDLSNEDVYLNLDYTTMQISFAEDDGGNISQDLMNGPPFEKLIPFQNIINTQPTTANFQETDISLEYDLNLDW